MAEYFSYGQFISCTSLVDFQQSNSGTFHKINLIWDLPTTTLYQYDKIEIYRYIDEYMIGVNPNNISESSSHSKLIYSAQQNVDINDEPNGTIIVERKFPYIIKSTIGINLTALNSFTDDFTTLNKINNDLTTYHSLTGIADNQTIINDIGFTRRVLYYILKTYIRGVTDAAPYLITPDFKKRNFVCHSTKSQVRHNYLHYEGDEIWCSKEWLAKIDPGISRTCVDINRIYKDPTHHAGSFGIGGHAWVSDRSTGRIFQHSLNNGFTIKSWRTTGSDVSGRGFGIGINSETGDCYGCPGDTLAETPTTPTVYRCDINKLWKKKADSLLVLNGDKARGYGIVSLYNYPNRLLITDYDCAGSPVIFKNFTNTGTSKAIYSPSGKTGGYAAAACPNGLGIQKSVAKSSSICSSGIGYVTIINPKDASWFTLNLEKNNICPAGTRISTDLHNLFPNTIINTNKTDLESRNYFSIWAGNEVGVYIPASATQASDCTINWAVDWKTDTRKYISGGGSVAAGGVRTAGYDGENNCWIVYGNKKSKIYRTDPNNSETFVFGVSSRYPAVSLSEWPYSLVNTREIEWFLTRNHGVSTRKFDNDEIWGVTFDIHGTTNKFRELDPTTLDNTITATVLEANVLYPGSPALTGTAYSVWWEMVEEKRLRMHYTNTLDWNTSYYKVYNSSGEFDTTTHKWGMRMKVDDIWQYYYPTAWKQKHTPIDKFYESESSLWLSKVRTKIYAWEAAFANIDSAYPNETLASRTQLVQNNKKGILVHPHYKWATPAVQNYYINNSLSDTQKTSLINYINSIKYINLHNFLTDDIYMYSDFTGNILAGTIKSSPLNIDITHPSVTIPSIVLLASGYQSNPDYQDKPAYCYPWANTIPTSMSANYDAITGYDDFNVTFLASTNMGSFLLTAFNLSADDYTPFYLNDINNDILPVLIKNTTYNDNNVYESIGYFNYTYHSPTINGLYYLPSGNSSVYEYRNPLYIKPEARFNAKSNIQITDLYNYNLLTNSCSSYNLSANAHIAVLERWPEPRFYIQTKDDKDFRKSLFCHSQWGYSGEFDKTSETTKESNATDAKRYDIVYGVDPLSAQILDRSIARTWPISSWHINITATNPRLNWSEDSFKLVSNSNLNVLQDHQNTFDRLAISSFRCGDYIISMNVQASTTCTSSDKPFVQYINVAEFGPLANFWAISAQTVSPLFSTTNASITGQLVNIDILPNGFVNVNNVIYPFISGYAPNLTVYFYESSEAHTFPISSYQWNFGDPFNEGPADITQLNSNYYTITNVSLINGDFNDNPVCWNTNSQNHTAVHTYIMPGTYDVTLTVEASTTSTSNICARYIESTNDNKKFYIYVEEILPQCNNSISGSLVPVSGFTSLASGVSGNSSLTSYFIASSIIAGSFPICRIDWDFGDGTVEKIIRYPLTSATNQGIPLINISAYTYDLKDPRNICVPHIYTNSTNYNQTFDIHISAYACNTNSIIYCSAYQLIGPVLPETRETVSDIRKLIGSRFDEEGNLIYILEGQTEKVTYTVTMSGELTC